MCETDTFTPEEIKIIHHAKKMIKLNLHEFELTILKVHKQKQFFVSGGCTASLLQGLVPKDYDIFFKNEDVSKKIIKLYTKDPSYTNEVAVAQHVYRDLNVGDMMITENAVTLKNRLQLITKHYGSPDEIRKTFDFVHCMPYYDSESDTFYISREQYDCCVNKVLKINNLDNYTKFREEKFLQKGYEKDYR